MTQTGGRLTDVDYWITRQDYTPPATKREWIYGRYLDPFMPRGAGLSALEVGVYPGRHLLYLAQNYGYRITGVDFSPHLPRLDALFRSQGIDASFVQADFFQWEPQEQFDVVVSHGFIEHFDDYQGVIERHWQWVKPGGLMALSVPVLTPLQRAVRLVAYTSEHWRYVLDSHNTQIMNLARLRQAVAQCEGSMIVVARYVNWMTVWFGPKSSGVCRWTAPLFTLVHLLERVARKLDMCNGLISPEILVAAQKVSAH